MHKRNENLVVCNGYYNPPKAHTDFINKNPGTIQQHLPAGFMFDDLQDGNKLIKGR
jgi:hypothetical protein